MDIPRVIADRFRVEREIGRGGMGTVYRATHLGLERIVAVKILKPEFAADPEVGERFMREARTMARLRHPRAAMIFDAGRLPDGRPFIVMEHVEGETLADALAREGRFDAVRAVRVACEICDVLAEAHRLGIVHRDLKPSNIMLNARGVCVLDFGIAKVLADSTEVTRTHLTTESGLIIGTPRYMSPEQCLGQNVGPASDLYSVGVLLYEMLAGHPPFTDQLQSVVLVKQATAAPPSLVGVNAVVPRRLAFVTHALLAKQPANRPTSAQAARAQLERSLAPLSSFDAAPDPFAATVAALDARPAFAPRLLAGAIVCGLLGGCLLAWSRGIVGGSGLTKVQAAGAPHAAAQRFAGGQMDVPGALSGGNSTPDSAQTFTPAAARQLAASLVTRGLISDARALRTAGGAPPRIVAVRGEHETSSGGDGGGARLVVLEQRVGLTGGYRVATELPLDIDGFRGANWSLDVLDADNDGNDELLCTGTGARDDLFSRRLVLYAPAARQTYSVRVGLDGREARAMRVRWSANAAGERAKPYRAALRERALASMPRARS